MVWAFSVNGGDIPDGAGVYAVFNADKGCEYVGLSRKVRGLWIHVCKFETIWSSLVKILEFVHVSFALDFVLWFL